MQHPVLKKEVLNSPVSGIPESWEGSYLWPEIEKGIKDGTVCIVTKKGYSVKLTIPHDCNCEHCDHTEEIEEFFERLSDAKDFIEESDGENAKIESDVWIIKAVRQNRKIPGGLFSGGDKGEGS